MNTTGRSRPETPDHGHGDDSMFGMMAKMMAMCAGTLLLIVLVLPALGYPWGWILVFAAVALMLALHARSMSHGGRD